MKRMPPAIAVAMVAAATVAATASASHNGKITGPDFAVGGGAQGTTQFTVAAHQTQRFLSSGELSYRTPSQRIDAEVLCLRVEGNQAFVLAEVTRFSGDPPLAGRIAFEMSDGNGAQPDTFSAFFSSSALGCSLMAFVEGPITAGNIVVHDGVPG